MEVLNDDYLNDLLNAPQLFTIDVWVEQIEITEGVHKNISDEAKRSNSEKKTNDNVPSMTEGSTQSKTDETGNIGLSAKSKEKTMPSPQEIKRRKASTGKKTTMKEEPENAKKKFQNMKILEKKKLSFGEDRLSDLLKLFSISEFTFPNGHKPFRIKFSIFESKTLSLTQIDFEKLFKFSEAIMPISQLKKSLDFLKDSAQMSSSTVDGIATETQDQNVEIDESTKEGSFVIKEEMKTGKDETSFDNKSGQGDVKKMSSASETNKESLGSPKAATTRGSKKSERFEINMINVRQIDEKLDKDLFLPKSEQTFMKGGCATVAMTPLMVIRGIQSGPVELNIDRYGGGSTKEDPNDHVGVAKLNFPSNWHVKILRVVNNPLSCPASFKVTSEAPVETESGDIIGKVDYTLTLTCYSRCAVTTQISDTGLHTSLQEAKPLAEMCHSPTVRQNIVYRELKRKSLEKNYEKQFY